MSHVVRTQSIYQVGVIALRTGNPLCQLGNVTGDALEHARLYIGERRTTAEVSVTDAPRRQNHLGLEAYRIRGADLVRRVAQDPR